MKGEKLNLALEDKENQKLIWNSNNNNNNENDDKNNDNNKNNSNNNKKKNKWTVEAQK